MKAGLTSIAYVLLITSCTPPKETKSEYPLLETMGYYQRFSDKLWLAGINQNWELAEFYNHELEEVSEEFVEETVIHDNINLSEMAGTTIVSAVEAMEEAIEQKNELLFVKNYKALVLSCNKCHTASGHGFIEIAVPDSTNVFNQKF